MHDFIPNVVVMVRQSPTDHWRFETCSHTEVSAFRDWLKSMQSAFPEWDFRVIVGEPIKAVDF